MNMLPVSFCFKLTFIEPQGNIVVTRKAHCHGTL